MAMAAMGIYGVMSYSVAARRGEFGLRMALGAGRGEVRRIVMIQGVKLLALGGAVGIVGALALTRVMASLVIGVSPTDPLTLVGVPVVLLLVALAANYVPAFRATRISPMVAMRTD